jgi:hypothetical protein
VPESTNCSVANHGAAYERATARSCGAASAVRSGGVVPAKDAVAPRVSIALETELVADWRIGLNDSLRAHRLPSAACQDQHGQ